MSRLISGLKWEDVVFHENTFRSINDNFIFYVKIKYTLNVRFWLQNMIDPCDVQILLIENRAKKTF